MKRIIILTIATILLVYAGMNAQELIQKEKTSSQEYVITITPSPSIEVPTLSHTFVLSENTNSSQSNLTLESIGNYKGEVIKSEQTPSQWKLSQNDTFLQISTNPSDTSPFGADLEPDITLLNSRLTANQIYRVKVDESFYFYTNRYYNDSCGQRYCSNGLLSTDSGEDLSIYCVLGESSPDELSFCDNIVVNLNDKSI
ncbi:MAG TPA: hypothetical protein PLS50_08615 [Candidatus Dojkabacteria bacterium]|nr:hypothetical protein [Candidatus Dojkabacteria bacterium]HRP51794.1 hypothetical protein [Candidatus Dojkabacteria bacterium]